MRKHLLTLTLCLFASHAFACETIPMTVATQAKPVKLEVELATDEEGREKGLMYRKSLEHDGMLFLFPKTGFQKFWMKNTPLPLDIIFIDASNKIIAIVASATPNSLTPLGPDAPIRTVLELGAGQAKKHGIAVGDEIAYELPSSVTVR